MTVTHQSGGHAGQGRQGAMSSANTTPHTCMLGPQMHHPKGGLAGQHALLVSVASPRMMLSSVNSASGGALGSEGGSTYGPAGGRE